MLRPLQQSFRRKTGIVFRQACRSVLLDFLIPWFYSIFSTHSSIYFFHPFPRIYLHLWIPFHFPIWFFGLRPSNASTSILIINLFRSLRAFFLSLLSVHFTSVVNVSLTVGWASFRCGSTATVNKIFKVRGSHARKWGFGQVFNVTRGWHTLCKKRYYVLRIWERHFCYHGFITTLWETQLHLTCCVLSTHLCSRYFSTKTI